jgi:hypothetical protein
MQHRIEPKYPHSKADRKASVERYYLEHGWEGVERLDEWDGEDLEFLRSLLHEEDFQVLLEHFEGDER